NTTSGGEATPSCQTRRKPPEPSATARSPAFVGAGDEPGFETRRPFAVHSAAPEASTRCAKIAPVESRASNQPTSTAPAPPEVASGADCAADCVHSATPLSVHCGTPEPARRCA